MANIDASGINSQDIYLALGDSSYTDTILFDLNNTYYIDSSWVRNKIYVKAASYTSYGAYAQFELNLFGDFPADGSYVARSAYISGFDISYKIQRKDMGRIKVRNMNMLYSTAYYGSVDEIETQLLSKSDKVIGSKYGDQFHSLGGADKIYGRRGNDKIYGSKGSNILNGGTGNDLLSGGSGNDQLIGGIGNDKLIGGKGKDIFKLSKGKGYDLILDFKNKQDKIFIGSVKKLKLKNKGKDVLIYKGKDLLAKVEGGKGLLSKKGKYLV